MVSSLQISNLSLKIDKNLILHDINLNLKSGHFNALIGTNGAGKSSLLSCIMGFCTKYSGEIKFDGMDLKKQNAYELAKIISYMPQFSTISHLSVYEILKLGRRVFSGIFLKDKDHSEILSAITRFKLEKWLDKPISSLSGGERQKVMIAASLLQKPRILLLDEPISHLDPKNQYEMLQIIKSETARNNLTSIVVLHDIHHALHNADTIVMLKNGEILSCKNAEQINENDLSTLFDTPICLFETKEHKFAYFTHSHEI